MSSAKRRDPITALIFASIPDLEQAVTQALVGGASLNEVVDMFVDIVDSNISWSALPVPWGLIVEAGDGPLLRLIVRALVKRIEKEFKK